MELSQRYPQLRLRQLLSGNISLKSSNRPRSRVKTTDLAQSLNQKWAQETLGEWSRGGDPVQRRRELMEEEHTEGIVFKGGVL